MTHTVENILNDVLHGNDNEDKQISIIDDTTLQINLNTYKIIKNYREGFQKEAFINRYQDFFEKYDFIVGDWGHEQLRLRGFYHLGKRKVARDQQIDFFEDYINEYCNFGCAYFVIAKIEMLERKLVPEPFKSVNLEKEYRTTPVVQVKSKASGQSKDAEKKQKSAQKNQFNRRNRSSMNQANKKVIDETPTKTKDNSFVIKKVKR